MATVVSPATAHPLGAAIGQGITDRQRLQFQQRQFQAFLQWYQQQFGQPQNEQPGAQNPFAGMPVNQEIPQARNPFAQALRSPEFAQGPTLPQQAAFGMGMGPLSPQSARQEFAQTPQAAAFGTLDPRSTAMMQDLFRGGITPMRTPFFPQQRARNPFAI
jgi:hypothetical protein